MNGLGLRDRKEPVRTPSNRHKLFFNISKQIPKLEKRFPGILFVGHDEESSTFSDVCAGRWEFQITNTESLNYVFYVEDQSGETNLRRRDAFGPVKGKRGSGTQTLSELLLFTCSLKSIIVQVHSLTQTKTHSGACRRRGDDSKNHPLGPTEQHCPPVENCRTAALSRRFFFVVCLFFFLL